MGCNVRGVIYEIECAVCKSKYIGETGRALVSRVKEHLADSRYYQSQTRKGPFAAHRRDEHNGEEIGMNVKILAVERKLQERLIKEALFIRKENPQINGRAEMSESLKFLCEI